MATLGADMSQPGPADTAGEFSARLAGLQEVADAASPSGAGTIPMRQVFDLAKKFIGLPLPDIERLLDVPDHLTRVGAVSIMDFQARRRSTDQQQRRGLYELYLRRHDRIDTWDLVDRAAPHVVGGYLSGQTARPAVRARRLSGTGGSGVPPLSRPGSSSARTTSTTPSGWPTSWPTTQPTSSRRRSAAGSAKPASETRSDWAPISTGTPPPCRAPPSDTRSNTCPRATKPLPRHEGDPEPGRPSLISWANLWPASAISESAFSSGGSAESWTKTRP